MQAEEEEQLSGVITIFILLQCLHHYNTNVKGNFSNIAYYYKNI